MVATEMKKATQVNLDKAAGGQKPLTMLEESLEAIEGPVACRKNKARQQWPTGTVYPSSNISGEAKRRAAAEVLNIDALVFEDNIKHTMPLCRSPTDYEKYFNIIERASAEAAEECMGVPLETRAPTAEAFESLTITIETRWGPTPAVVPDTGYVQGSRGASEQSKPAQSPILNLRANSSACYITFGGIEVYAAGFVDDTEHYGKGINDLAKNHGRIWLREYFNWNRLRLGKIHCIRF